MNATRREFIGAVAGATGIAASASVVSGCRHIPEADVVRLCAKGIGGATGLALNECDLSDGVRNAIVEVADRVLHVIPQPGQSLEDAWTPHAQKYVDGLVATGKIDAALGNVVMAAFRLVMKGYALVETRHPRVRVVRELMESALAGFSEGLLSTMKPVNALEAAPVDVEAFKELKSTQAYLVFRSAAEYAPKGSN